MEGQLELCLGLLCRRRGRSLSRNLLLLLRTLLLASSSEEDLLVDVLLLEGDERVVSGDRSDLARLDAVDGLLLLERRAGGSSGGRVAREVIDDGLAVLDLGLIGRDLGLVSELGGNLESLSVLSRLALGLELLGLSCALARGEEEGGGLSATSAQSSYVCRGSTHSCIFCQ